jgi:hypothetical protein
MAAERAVGVPYGRDAGHERLREPDWRLAVADRDGFSHAGAERLAITVSLSGFSLADTDAVADPESDRRRVIADTECHGRSDVVPEPLARRGREPHARTCC